MNTAGKSEMFDFSVVFLGIIAVVVVATIALAEETNGTECYLFNDERGLLCYNLSLTNELDILISPTVYLTELNITSCKVYSSFTVPTDYSSVERVILTSLLYYEQPGSLNSTRLPFNHLLRGSTPSPDLTTLIIGDCDLRSITSNDFCGLHNLQHLQLYNSTIENIDVKAFSCLSALRIFYLSDDNLATFDWSILDPVASNIESLYLNNTQLKNLTWSGNIASLHLRMLRYLDLSHNDLEGIPSAVLDTLELYDLDWLPLTVKLDNLSNLCCDCCPFEPFVQWITQVQESAIKLMGSGNCSYKNGTSLPFGSEGILHWNTQNIPLDTFKNCNRTEHTTVTATVTEHTTAPSVLDAPRTSFLVILFGIILSTFAGLLLLVLLFLLAIKKYNRSRSGKQKRPESRKERPVKLSIAHTKLDKTISNRAPSEDVFEGFRMKDWDVSVKHVNVLGAGYFGKVYLGEIVPSFNYNHTLSQPFEETDAVQVAIKTWKNVGHTRFQEEFYAEVSTMVNIGRHENIVELLGFRDEGEMFLVLEYCINGALDKFLRGVQKSIHFANNAERREQNIYVTRPGSSENHRQVETDFGEKDLIRFCHQICSGMSHIASLGIVHRDLAARNILLDSHMRAKISDFGMAREVSVYVLKRQNVPLPIKWMAPESIKSHVFSLKSDVWSYGVVMWEIFALGAIPYCEKVNPISNHELLERLQHGYRLSQPKQSSVQLYDIMMRCWQWKPLNRPTFDELRNQTEILVSLLLGGDMNKPAGNVSTENSLYETAM